MAARRKPEVLRPLPGAGIDHQFLENLCAAVDGADLEPEELLEARAELLALRGAAAEYPRMGRALAKAWRQTARRGAVAPVVFHFALGGVSACGTGGGLTTPKPWVVSCRACDATPAFQKAALTVLSCFRHTPPALYMPGEKCLACENHRIAVEIALF